MLCQVSHLIIYVKNQGGLLISQKNKCIKLSVLFSVRARLNICIFFSFPTIPFPLCLCGSCQIFFHSYRLTVCTDTWWETCSFCHCWGLLQCSQMPTGIPWSLVTFQHLVIYSQSNQSCTNLWIEDFLWRSKYCGDQMFFYFFSYI